MSLLDTSINTGFGSTQPVSSEPALRKSKANTELGSTNNRRECNATIGMFASVNRLFIWQLLQSKYELALIFSQPKAAATSTKVEQPDWQHQCGCCFGPV